MSAAAKSIVGYGIWLVGQGLVLLLVPNIALRLFGLPEALDVWVRVTGMTVTFFGVYYFVAARHEWRPFFVTTLFTRLAVPVVFAIFAATSLASWNILLFTPADILFTAWTWWALRADARAAQPAMA
jgi:hypothetical protein